MNKFEKRIKLKINKNAGCWTYGKYGKIPGSTRPKIYINGNMKIAARVIWELFIGKIPQGMKVCHKCDNPYCVNPKHLFLGTSKDNIQDALLKGRMWSKMTAKRVKKLRKDYKNTELTLKELAKKYKISRPNVGHICSRRTWNHV